MTDRLLTRFGDLAHPPTPDTPWAAVDGHHPEVVVHPTGESELVDLVRLCGENGWSLLPSGRGHALDRGPALRACRVVVSLDRVAGISYSNPADLVLSARAGTPLAAVRERAAAEGLRLAVEPPAWQEASVGGAVALGRSGVNRYGEGRIRDLVLGVGGVLADGTAFQAGSRVVKNVAGYDLTRLLIGSRGAFAILTEVTFKLLPEPRHRTTLAGPEQALPAALEAALPLRHPGLDPAALVVAGTPGSCRIALALAGEEADVAHRTARLPAPLEPGGPTPEALQEGPPQARGEGLLLRLFAPPTRLAGVLSHLPAEAVFCADLLTGRVDLATPVPAEEELIRAAATADGWCLVEAGPAAARTPEKTLSRISGPEHEAARYLRRAFDPAGILCPGRWS